MTIEEFMNIVYSELHSDGDNYRANRIIDAADEYAEEQTRWIPVSERLPEEDGEYLVTVKATIKGVPNYILHCNFGLNLYKVDEYDFVERRGIAGFYKYDSEYGYYEVLNAVAWMPLPEPYRASPTGAESGGAGCR